MTSKFIASDLRNLDYDETKNNKETTMEHLANKTHYRRKTLNSFEYVKSTFKINDESPFSKNFDIIQMKQELLGTG